MKKKAMKRELKASNEFFDELSDKFCDIEDDLFTSQTIIDIRDNKIKSLEETIERLHDYNNSLESQLTQLDKAIKRKDRQFLGLRSAYQDALINNQV